MEVPEWPQTNEIDNGDSYFNEEFQHYYVYDYPRFGTNSYHVTGFLDDDEFERIDVDYEPSYNYPDYFNDIGDQRKVELLFCLDESRPIAFELIIPDREVVVIDHPSLTFEEKVILTDDLERIWSGLDPLYVKRRLSLAESVADDVSNERLFEVVWGTDFTKAIPPFPYLPTQVPYTMAASKLLEETRPVNPFVEYDKIFNKN